MSTAQFRGARAPEYVSYDDPYSGELRDDEYVPFVPDRPRAVGAARSGGRHRAPTETSAVVTKVATTAGVTTAIVGSFAAVASPAGAAADASGWAQVRQCESGGNYATNTGNGYYGAYQFSEQTWQALGYSGLPSSAAPAVQDQAAQKLYAQSGAGQWPVCGRFLAGVPATDPGPITTQGSTSTSQAPSLQPTTPTQHKDTSLQPTFPSDAQIIAATEKAPKTFPGTELSTKYSSDVRLDTLRWQAAMRQKSFVVPLDGRYGPQTAGLASFYSYLTKVSDGAPGVVGPQVWSSSLH